MIGIFLALTIATVLFVNPVSAIAMAALTLGITTSALLFGVMLDLL